MKGDLVSFGARKGAAAPDGGMDVDGEGPAPGAGGGAGATGGSMALIQNTLMYAKELERIV